MPKKNGQTILAVIVSLLLFTFIMFLSVSKLPLQILPLIFVLAPIVFIITFINTDVALIILIFSMLLSPELKLVEVPTRAVVVRIDDILLFVIFFSWLAKTAINKQLGLFKNTPLNLPIIAYILVCILSTGIGILTGHIQPLKSFFYILKYIEYFMLYFLVTNNIRNKEQIKIFIAFFLVTCALVCGYAYTQIGTVPRVTAPFEGYHAEPNTLGGYLVLLFAVCSGLFLYSRLAAWRLSSGLLACFIIPPFLFSLSRSSYASFVVVYLVLVVLSKRKKLLLVITLLLAILFLPMALPTEVTERVTGTFVPGSVYEAFGQRIGLDSAAAIRVEVWKLVVKEWKKRPLLGFGVTGVGFIDSQYARLLAETGIIGLWIFGWLILTIFRTGLKVFKTVEDDWARGLSLGFLAGFVGLLIHSLTTNTFIIVRIMEPFWFLAAIVVMLPRINSDVGGDSYEKNL